MSIDVKVEEPVSDRSNGHVPAASAPVITRPWNRRRYQVIAGSVVVIVTAALVANNFLARQYSPGGAVTEYLRSVQSGDAATAWRLMQVTPDDKATAAMIGRSDLEAALNATRPDFGNFAITQTTRFDSSTSAVDFSYDTNSGTKQGRLMVKRSAENNFQIYPGWQVVIVPAELHLTVPAGAGGVHIDGKSVAVDGNATVAVLPLGHKITFPGTSMVEPEDVSVDVFSGAPVAVAYKATLTPAGVARATAAINGSFASCAAQTLLEAAGCPQTVSGVSTNSGQWQLIGDPTQGLTFGLDSAGNPIAAGHFQMVFTYNQSGVTGPIHKPAAGGYEATLTLTTDDVAVGGIKGTTASSPLVRPAAATDDAVEAIVAKALKACAGVASGNPGACPQSFYFPDSTSYHWTLLTDPLLNARVTYDPATGMFTVNGSFEMKLNYKINGYPYTTYSATSDYAAYLFWDGGQLVLVTIDGQ